MFLKEANETKSDHKMKAEVNINLCLLVQEHVANSPANTLMQLVLALST